MIRHRLLGPMAGRFERTLTVVEAPAGYGKTTLIRQAIEEAAAAELGRDVLVRATHPDMPLSTLLVEAVRLLSPGARTSADPVATWRDLVWSAAPDHVCLVVDDTHLLAPDAGPEVQRLIAALPANGHLVLCGRSLPVAPPVVVGDATTDALSLHANDLAFDPDERAAYRRLNATSPDPLGDTGWPALLALHTTEVDLERLLRDDVIGHLRDDQRSALAVLAVRRGFDESLVRAVTPFTGSLADLIAGVPLTSIDGPTCHVHDLVREALLAQLDPVALSAARTAVSRALVERGEWTDAIALARSAGDLDQLRSIAHAVAEQLHIGVPDAHWLTTLDELVAAMPGTVAADVLGALAAVTRDQPIGLPMMQQAAARARAEGDADLEALCISRLSEAAFGLGRMPMLRMLAERLDELAAGGCPIARKVRFRPHLWLATIDQANTVAHLDTVPSDVDPTIARWVAFDRVRALSLQGHLRAAISSADQIPTITDPLQRVQLDGFLAIQRWLLGELGVDGMHQVHRLLDRAELHDAPHLFTRAAATTSMMAATMGDRLIAIETLERARHHLPRVAEGAFARHVVAQAEAVLAALEGDDERAAAHLRAALPADGLGVLPPFAWQLSAATMYVLHPEVRDFLDGAVTGPDLELRRSVVRALVAWRDRQDPEPAAALPWHEADQMRHWLVEPHLGQLAAAAMQGGSAAAAGVFERFRHDPRSVLSRLADSAEPTLRDRLAGIARGLPRRPPDVLRIEVLGPARLMRGGSPVVDEAWTRRQRVRDLLLLIVAHRSLTRSQVMASIWPDKPERTAASNLRFTLNQLHSVLEPERASDDQPWYVMTTQDRLALRASELVVVDVDEFTDAVTAGDDFDREGEPELALAAYRKAATVYRGDYLADASDPDWGYYEGLRLRGQFVRVAARASSLALAAGDLAEAEQLAHRAVTIEPLYEPAVRAMAATMMANRRLGAAREALSKLTAELASAGIAPEPATMQLVRRLGGD